MKEFIKNSVKKGFNVKRWLAFDEVKSNTVSVKKLAQDVFSNPADKPAQPETFEQAVKRFNLSEQDIQKRMQMLFYTALGCVVGMVLALLYAIYLFSSGMVLAGFMSTLLGLSMGVYGFREHFNYFQMKQRRLGCRIGEWFKFLCQGGR